MEATGGFKTTVMHYEISIMKIWCISIYVSIFISLKKRAKVFSWKGYLKQKSFFC